ncbi:RNA-binding S4 domain-containing protein [Xylophilus ampelinus]|uniref:Heat shock protein Hsp15 n=1 Tax=Xylophilus ampelinus TaxID=54067 RepID=A0A318SDS8_9BURK|nr:S4 domain-containing protein [Xylophilus ampelinus]MCS4511446.1 S4 domain-containing protein [Xylophilus ampelinus]PYE74856.1 heat shock protein Hsp15 [Xylophilus ampelinus]
MVVLDTMRLDKWLWCARFYKTRGLAAEEVAKGRVLVNGNAAKPAKDLRPGDNVVMRHGPLLRTVTVRGLSGMRGPASVAQALYEETPDSVQARERAAEQRRLAPEPADTLAHGRPTKRDRRSIEQAGHGWNERWSASVDD